MKEILVVGAISVLSIVLSSCVSVYSAELARLQQRNVDFCREMSSIDPLRATYEFNELDSSSSSVKE
jgi:hypothetical protein